MAADAAPIMTSEQVEAFREQGYLAIPQLIDDAAVAQLRDACDQFLGGGCALHLDGTLHHTGGNRSRDRPRRAHIFSVCPKEVSWL